MKVNVNILREFTGKTVGDGLGEELVNNIVPIEDKHSLVYKSNDPEPLNKYSHFDVDVPISSSRIYTFHFTTEIFDITMVKDRKVNITLYEESSNVTPILIPKVEILQIRGKYVKQIEIVNESTTLVAIGRIVLFGRSL